MNNWKTAVDPSVDKQLFYSVETMGCQMNSADSERIKGQVRERASLSQRRLTIPSSLFLTSLRLAPTPSSSQSTSSPPPPPNRRRQTS